MCEEDDEEVRCDGKSSPRCNGIRDMLGFEEKREIGCTLGSSILAPIEILESNPAAEGRGWGGVGGRGWDGESWCVVRNRDDDDDGRLSGAAGSGTEDVDSIPLSLVPPPVVDGASGICRDMDTKMQ